MALMAPATGGDVMKEKDRFPEALEKYENKWIAVTSDEKEIIATGNSLKPFSRIVTKSIG